MPNPPPEIDRITGTDINEGKVEKGEPNMAPRWMGELETKVYRNPGPQRTKK